jgi:molecular chaperone DnaK (HSP70)
MSKYVVGIDLGTTNCAVAYAAPDGDGTIRPFPIAQLTAPGEVDDRATLPSFLLLPAAHEVKPEAMALPWQPAPGWAVGTMARERGAELPHRLVSSAKSWLCHPGVDRSAPILPWRGAEGEDEAAEGEEAGARVSPVDASARYLAHIRKAWDAAFPDDPLEEQDVFLTVPASFDAAARELTVQAAELAGLEATLLEEPQAAFYAFLAAAGDGWRDELHAGDVALVCDIGGGTSDFSLIQVTDDGAGNLELERVAVGDHILLGGDNMDLALAHGASQKLQADGKKLKTSQYHALVHGCRRAKEQLLVDGGPDKATVTLLGGGSKLIGGTIKVEVTRAEAEALVLDGFFPRVAAGAAPKVQRSLGLRELGLPYATDAAVTRHLAGFLGRHGKAPTAILFNGGVMQSPLVRRRVVEVVSSWFGAGELPALGGTDLDLAVAHGAAYYGLVRRGKGIRIRGGTAQSYYIGVESAAPAIPGFSPPIKALCVAPFGMEEGTSVELPAQELGFVVGEPTTFRFFASTARKDDRAGAVLDPDDAELSELSPVEAHLPAEGAPAGDLVPVTLSAHVTEIGTLELWGAARGGGGRWKLEYSLRDPG